MHAASDDGHGATGNEARALAALEPEQRAGARRHYGRRALSAGALAAMWGLRLYALLMVLVVLYSVAQVLHPGG